MKKVAIAVAVAVALLTSLAGCGGSSSDSPTPTPTPTPTPNSAPTANADGDQNIATTTVVTLNGSASSDPDGDAISYSWSLNTVPAGSSASLSDSANVSPTFTADVDGSYIAQLIVNDGTVDSVADTVTIIAATGNAVPVANAGVYHPTTGVDQNVSTGHVVTLDARASSDTDGDALSYTWSLTTIPTGSNAALDVSTSALSRFTADVDGSYIAQLIVNDGTVDSAPYTLTIIAANTAPVANAGVDQNIPTTTVVTINGSASTDADSNALSYSWSLTTIPTGSNAALDVSTSVLSRFTADVDGSYIAQLIVNDGIVDSVADTLTIVAATGNSAPVANAGADQNIPTTTVVTINGSASSDADSDALSYSWSLNTVPAGSSASLSDSANVSPTFTADVDGSYIAQLIVNDGTVDSVADTVTIIAATGNAVPVANAGEDQNVSTISAGNWYTDVFGSASSDADGDALTSVWSLTTVPNGSEAFSDNYRKTGVGGFSIKIDVDGYYVAQLIVNDGTVDSVPDTVTIIATTANSSPVANAGADQNVLAGTTVFLNANGSSDADGDGLLYTWSFVSRPTGSSATFDSDSVENPSFTPDLNGSYVISLVVNDGFEDGAPDNITITAIEPTVKLYSKSFFGSGFDEVSFPYSSNGIVNGSVSGIPTPTTYSLDTFKLLAEGQNFTITNLIVTASTSQVVPFFSGLTEGLELVNGTEIEFELVSPLTRGATVILNFSFEIQETGDTFSSSYTFTSN
jgi:predicted aspartyl protease